jgi:hypothetical protein
MADPRRSTFAPVVLAGLASSGLAAVAGHRDWAVVEDGAALVTDTDAGAMPLAGALALVLLAVWGVLLVTRGRVRRAVAVLGLGVALAMATVAVVGYSSAPANLRRAVAQLAFGNDVGVHRSGWYWVSLAAAVLSVVVSAAAVVLGPSWPEMGTRYDAPGAAPAPRETTDLDLWKAMDEGRDPTLTDRRPADP